MFKILLISIITFILVIIIFLLFISFMNNDIKTSSKQIENFFVSEPTFTNGIKNNVVGSTTDVYIQFNSNGTLTLPNPITVDILIVGGGGAGGSRHGGGGGAGAVIYLTNQTISSGSYNIIIGLGGTGVSSMGQGSKGNDTSITLSGTNIYLAKGGGAGNHDVGTGDSNRDGASGGGGGSVAGVTILTNIPVGTYGFNGGGGQMGGSGGGERGFAGGGGGGAGGTGLNGSENNYLAIGGNGGIGKQISITGTNIYYGGGGGGGCASSAQSAGNGGSGGGGAGSKGAVTATSGTANTGGGGGGSGFVSSSDGTSGNGGSGVVIIRYNRIKIQEEQEIIKQEQDRIQREQSTITSELIDSSPVLTEDQEFNKNNRAYEYIHKYDINYLNLNSITPNTKIDNGITTFTKQNSNIKYEYSSSNSASNNPTNLFNNKLQTNINIIYASFASNRYNSGGNFIGNSAIQGDFISIEFPEPFKLKKYSFISKDIQNAPASWILYAGDNLIEEKTANKTDYDETLTKSPNTYVSFLNTNEISAKKYKIVFKKTFGGTTLNFGQIKLEEGREATIQATSPSSFPPEDNYIL